MHLHKQRPRTMRLRLWWFRRNIPARVLRVRTLSILLSLLFIFTVIETALVYSAYEKQDPKQQEPRTVKGKIFIASIHWNNEEILRENWIPSILVLAKHLGSDNVFVSVQESGSWDRSKEALRSLDMQLEGLGIRRRIILDETTHKDNISKPPGATGWVRTPRGRIELRRIPYLAYLRNLVLEPLQDLAEEGVHFDKILWINDVVFDVGSITVFEAPVQVLTLAQLHDITNLLTTRDGDYAAACALDFAKPPKFYDTFALRDADGQGAMMQTWPYFRSRKSRNAVKYGLPVPVTSCWNGIVSIDAQPFYNTTQPLLFRGIPDSLAEQHVEGSECCLIHADNPESLRKGVWLNPMVRVGYSSTAYHAIHSKEGFLSFRTILEGLWENRFRRWFTTQWFETSVARHRLAAWRSTNSSNEERGKACLINEMQVLVENGWAHV